MRRCPASSRPAARRRPSRVTLAGPRHRRPEGARRRTTSCCTAPTPSPTGWCWSRRWPPAGRSSRPTAPARARSCRTAPAASTRPATPSRPRRRCAPRSTTPRHPHAARRRAEAAFDVRDSVARLEAHAAVSFAAVVVLHRSRAELAQLLPTLHADAADRRRRRPRRRRGANWRAEHGAEVIVRRDNPGFGAANNLALERVTQPVTVLLNPDVIVHGDALERLAERTHRARPARPAAAQRRRQRPAQRAPAPGHARRLPARPRPPAAAAQTASAIASSPTGRDTPRTVGWAIAACLAATTRRCRASTPRSTSSPRTWTCASEPAPKACRPTTTPTSRSPTPAATASQDEPFETLARQRRDVDRAHAGRHRAAPRRRRPTAHVRHPRGRQRPPQRKRARPVGRALNRSPGCPGLEGST